jgi:hypothetical protein
MKAISGSLTARRVGSATSAPLGSLASLGRPTEQGGASSDPWRPLGTQSTLTERRSARLGLAEVVINYERTPIINEYI